MGSASKDSRDPSLRPRSRRRVLIVDDHPIVRTGLAHLIAGEKDLEVCGEAQNACQAEAAAASLKPDVAVVDISLQGANGIELTKRLHDRFPCLPVLILSMHDEHLYAERALRAGARGYVMKQEDTGALLSAVRAVLRGEVYVSQSIASHLLADLVGSRNSGERTGGLGDLSDRELEVFELIGQGLSMGQIAGRLHLGVKTVETHRSHIKAKLKLATVADVVRRAVSWVDGHA